MNLSKETVLEFKGIYEKEKGMEITYHEAEDAANNLVGLYDLLFKMVLKDGQRERRLKKEPDGFPVDGNYSCAVCHQSINESNGWYHWGGPRCLLCHKAIKDGTIPSFVLKYRDSYFLSWHLKSTFNIHPQTVRKYVRLGILKARIILAENGKTHEHVFLKKENPGLIERYSPERKSYDRKKEKQHKIWAKAEKKKWLEELKSKNMSKKR